MRKSLFLLYLYCCSASLFLACTRAERFPTLGKSVAGPVDIAISADGKYFYTINSDLDRTYNKGSILVINENGKIESAIETARLGRVLFSSGKLLFAGFEGDEGGENSLEIYDISNPAAPTKEARFVLDCAPLGIAAVDGYGYYAVSCIGGGLYLGEIKTPLASSTLNKIRSWAVSRRALHIDTERHLLFAFTTDLGVQTYTDTIYPDQLSYDNLGKDTAEENEIPDDMERTQRDRERRSQREIYQFALIDLAQEANDGFVFKTSTSHPDIEKELRWTYFNLQNFDGFPDVTPDNFKGFTVESHKYYRTNFWAAQIDPLVKNVFYLSHRGPVKISPHSNNIVRVTIIGDPKVVDGKVPATKDYLKFERVYGFKGEAQAWHYPGDFRIVPLFGENVILVNHFRDLTNRSSSESLEFGLSVRPLNDFSWEQEIHDVSPSESFYQVAVNNRGVAMSCLFYANAVVRFQISPITQGLSPTRVSE